VMERSIGLYVFSAAQALMLMLSMGEKGQKTSKT
jgi:hypothetical protein